MVPRLIFDLSWSDLAAGAAASFTAHDRAEFSKRVETAFGGQPDFNLACLSVRSGFSALLTALNWPKGSRIAFSAITIKDMPRIAKHHGVESDAFDIDPETLAPSMASLAAAVTPQTRAIVVAHLFGARVDLSPVHAFAAERGLLVFEDCAQAYTGDGWCGHAQSDVAFFSFGPIKTATALGGAVLRFRSRELRARTAHVQAAWPVQSQAKFAQRVGRFAVLSTLSTRPVFSTFTAACDLLGKNWDAMIAQSARGFAGGDFFQRIHTQPCAALLSLLARRLCQSHAERLARRADAATALINALPGHGAPGKSAAVHAHWVVPLEFEHPQEAARVLRAHGFDATRGTSSMTVIGEDPGRHAPRARAAENRWLYVPCHARMTSKDRARLAAAVREAALATPKSASQMHQAGSGGSGSAPSFPANAGSRAPGGHTLGGLSPPPSTP